MLAGKMRMAASGASSGGEDQYYLSFNGTTTEIDCGSDASLDDIPDGGAMTIEFWLYPRGLGDHDIGRIINKGTGAVGYEIWRASSASKVRITLSGQNIEVDVSDDAWTHYAITYDDGGDRKIRAYVGGTLQGTSSAVAGAYSSDAAYDLIFGNYFSVSRHYYGDLAWARISDSVRYSTGFTPAAKDAPPAVDGNTVEQWNLNDGSGATAGAEVNGSNDGAITDGSWVAL